MFPFASFNEQKVLASGVALTVNKSLNQIKSNQSINQSINNIILHYITLHCTILHFIPCLEKYSKSDARIAVAYSEVFNR